jgi:MFS transporter, MHS family, proline/betaine transporter
MSNSNISSDNTLYPSSTQTKLTREQKEAVGLLSIGTFLEYFDLMLYVHMAVLLNELFFPKTDPFTKSLISAFSFCSTYILRPFGALIFGYIGDRMGRKSVVVMTTLIMSVSCLLMAIMPTYAQIGITASWIVTIVRMIQGLVATAEARGAEIYLTESTKVPLQYFVVALITVGSGLGTTAALGIASIATSKTFAQFNETSWRGAFLIGAVVALVGTIARTTLKESHEFQRTKVKELKNELQKHDIEIEIDTSYDNNLTKNSIYYFFTQCSRPPCFYFIYIYCADLLQNEFGFTPAQVINQNFLVSIVDLVGLIGISVLSLKVNPLKILRIKLYCFISVIVFFPYMVSKFHDSSVVFIFQSLAALFVFDHIPASPVFYRHFPIFKRFTYTSVLSAFAKLLTYFVTSFGLVFANKAFGFNGILLVFIPVGIAFYIAVMHFQKLEDKMFESTLSKQFG